MDQPEPEQLRTSVDEPRPGVLVIHVTGMLDLATAPELDVAALYSARSRAPVAEIRRNGVGAWDVEYVDFKEVRGNPVLNLCD